MLSPATNAPDQLPPLQVINEYFPVIFGPNITGTFQYDVYAHARTGCFINGDSGEKRSGSGGDYSSKDAETLMNANNCNSIFGRSTTIQPRSYRRYHLIKW